MIHMDNLIGTMIICGLCAEKLDIVNDAVKVPYIRIYGLHIALRQCTFHTREHADRI